MFSSRLFWKLFSGFAALYVAFALLFYVSVRRWHRQLVTNQVELRLFDIAEILRAQIDEQIPEDPAPELQRLARNIAARTDVYITLIAEDSITGQSAIKDVNGDGFVELLIPVFYLNKIFIFTFAQDTSSP